jgi:hypothetical protein
VILDSRGALAICVEIADELGDVVHGDVPQLAVPEPGEDLVVERCSVVPARPLLQAAVLILQPLLGHVPEADARRGHPRTLSDVAAQLVVLLQRSSLGGRVQPHPAAAWDVSEVGALRAVALAVREAPVAGLVDSGPLACPESARRRLAVLPLF